MSVRNAVLAVIAAALLAPSGASASSTMLFGFNDQAFIEQSTLDKDEIVRLEAEIGASTQRFGVSWARLQPGPSNNGCAAGAIQWGNPTGLALTAQYNRMLARNIRPILIVTDAPKWAWGEIGCGISGEALDPRCSTPANCHAVPGDRFLGQWAAFVEQVVYQYPEAAAIEIWNEPNVQHYWQAGPDPARYTRVFRAAADAVHRANDALGKSIPVVTGGLSHKRFASEPNGVRMSVTDFFNGMYNNGVTQSLRAGDGLGIHAYNEGDCITAPDTGDYTCTVWRRDAAINETRAVRDARDPLQQARSLWVTEMGLSSNVGEQNQCMAVRDSVAHFANQADVAAAVIHTFVDRPQGADVLNTGMVRQNLSLKPVYNALKLQRNPPGGQDCAGLGP